MDITVIFMQMVQLFLVIGLGYILYLVKILDKDFNKKLTSLLLSVTTPALIISSVLSQDSQQSLSDVAIVFIAAIVIFGILPLVGWVIAKIVRTKKEQLGLYIFMTMFSNIGFMGFPVMKAIFGDGAVFYTAIFNMIFNLLIFSFGVLLMNYGGAKKVKIRFKDMLTPGVIASLIALLIYFTKLQVPGVVATTITMVGDITTPIAMILIGSTLATIPFKEVFTEIRLYPYTLIKQVILPILAFPILNACLSDPLILGVSLIVISMPVANSAVLFATQYNRDVSLAAKAVFMTTLLSIVTIPLIVALFLM